VSPRSGDAEPFAYRAALDTLPNIVFIADPDGMLQWVNRRWYETTGVAREAVLGETWTSLVHPADRDEALGRWAQAVKSGKPFAATFRNRGADGHYRWYFASADAMRDDDGAIVRWYGTAIDVDHERRATRQLHVFAKVGDALIATLGLQETLDAVLPFIVPSFADWAFINLVDEAGDLRMAAVYHDDPAKQAILSAQIGELYAKGTATSGSPEAIRRQTHILYERAGFEDAARVVEPGPLQAVWEVGFGSVLVLPLVSGAVARGSLNVAMSSSGRAFHPTEIPFFHELARRIGQAVASAEIFERERRAARTFQAAALPSYLPTVDGMRFETLYEAAQSEAAIGGDWYDVFRLPDGRVVLSIGDVCGKGLHAAVAMASVRQSIRTAALINPDPAAVLSAVDRIVRGMDAALFVTAFAAVIDPVWFVMKFASAGHPPPLLRGPDNSLKTLRDPGLPLGLRERGEHTAARVAIVPGSMLVAYTDGLTEFDRDPIEGEQVVARALRAAGTHGVPRALFDAAARGRAAHDDIAILAVAFDRKLTDVDGPMRAASWEVDARDARAAAAVRRDFLQRLAAVGLDEHDVASAELVLVELLANVVRYTPGSALVVLDVSGHGPVVQVADHGTGFEFKPRLPADVMSEYGRGLFLIGALSNEFSVERRRGGGSRARVVLCGRVRPASAGDVNAGSGRASPPTSL